MLDIHNQNYENLKKDLVFQQKQKLAKQQNSPTHEERHCSQQLQS